MSAPKVIVALPARFGSSRLPGKPLADLHGKPLIQWSYEAAARVRNVDRVVVATDDQRILERVIAFGGEAIMTRADHATGSDRLVEVAEQLDAELIVNIQGDEIIRDPEMVAPLIQTFIDDDSLKVGTLCRPLNDREHLNNSNVVKVVRDHDDFALYFSRAPIPYPRDLADGADIPHGVHARHFGIYIFRREALMAFPTLPYSPLEDQEKLEQLRFLQAGFRIKVLATEHSAYRVDTPDDLQRVARQLAADG